MARYYNSNLGAFWSPDPAGLAAADPRDPVSWNRYSYVYGDPASYADPDGFGVVAVTGGPSTAMPKLGFCDVYPNAPGCSNTPVGEPIRSGRPAAAEPRYLRSRSHTDLLRRINNSWPLARLVTVRG
jgi:hypothetical protein